MTFSPFGFLNRKTQFNRGKNKIHIGMMLLAFLFGSFSYPMNVQAAVIGYSASIVSLTYPKQLGVGELGQVIVTVKNTGTATWFASGKNYTSVYRWDPVNKIEKASVFSTPAWPTNQQATRLTQDVKPNGTITIKFPIQTSLRGTITESYSFTAENLARMKGGSFDVSVSVSTAAPVQAPATPTPTQATAAIQIPAPAPTLLNLGTKEGWTAQLVSRGGTEWQLLPGEKGAATIAFKNTSNQIWKNSGANYVSLYAVDSGRKERVSSFVASTWISNSHPAKLIEAEVRPGQTGTFRVDLLAPMQPGVYQESFQLSAENMAWLGGGAVTLPITVPLTSQIISNSVPNPPQKNSYSVEELALQRKTNYMATLLLKSIDALSLTGNVTQQVTFGFKNAGIATWNSHSIRLRGLEPATTQLNSVRDLTWLSSGEAVSVNAVTKPGELAFATFRVKAPARKGLYRASFTLNVEGSPVDGGEINIPITVTADGYIEPAPTPTKVPSTPTTTPTPTNSSAPSISPIPMNGDESSLQAEPMIRVGLFKPADDVMTVAPMAVPLNVFLGNATVCSVPVGQSVTVRYNRSSQKYLLSGSNCSGESSIHYQVRAQDDIAPMQITTYSRPIAWLTGSNDNKFRARLELRFSPSTGDTWVIEELPIEYYLRGIAETSNSSPQEFQRTLLVAARTYAMYHVQRQTKHAAKFFYVDAELDQVYRGYASESRTPNVVAAVMATRAQVVTYNSQIAITPYFSNSDGRTRGWNEVWGGTSPAWIHSVPVPYDQGKTLWGHGVGMSASGAVGMARDGKTYDTILKYFFKNVELRKAYK